MSMSDLSSQRLAVLLLLAGVGLSGCEGLSTAPTAAVQQQIQAATARVSAEEHRKKGKAYQMAPPGGRGGSSMPAHCNNTAASYEEIASRFDAMAAEHRNMATQAKPSQAITMGAQVSNDL